MGFDIPEPFQWDPSFDVKNDIINEQHKSLFKQIVELNENQKDGARLTFLLEYVQMHFKTEEDLFTKCGYDAAKTAAHKEIHAKFVADAVAATKDGVNDGIITFLKDWLVNHIKACDMLYADTLAGKS